MLYIIIISISIIVIIIIIIIIVLRDINELTCCYLFKWLLLFCVLPVYVIIAILYINFTACCGTWWITWPGCC